jgi:tRNA-2-methylthio-N6-dimethylallyladenosine synthase
MSQKFFIETFGCQMNELDSEKMAGSLAHSGMERAAGAAEADVLILNTCSVREKAVQKVYARLGSLKREKARRRDMVVGVVGCMAQLEGERILAKAPFVSLIAGPQKGHVMSDLVDRARHTGSPAIDLRMDDDPEPLETTFVLRESPWRAGVTIGEGCSRQCTFCVVPFTRGKERNRDSAGILREVEQLAADGYVEIVLLGQTVNSYRDPVDRSVTFPVLLARVASVPGVRRVRFTSPHPVDFTDALLAVMMEHPQICNQVHLPVQSGSTAVLRSMVRGYSRKRYSEIVRKIKAVPRPIAISTDIIVGYPGEKESDFRDTLSLLDEVQYDQVFSFKYSPRPNTKALELADDVPDEEKGRRLTVLQEQQRLIQFNLNAGWLGRTAEVLVEERARSRFALAGRTTENKVVNFDGPEELIGSFATVQITGFSANSLKGTLAAPEGARRPVQ